MAEYNDKVFHSFNSIKVRLKHIDENATSSFDRSFNSIKVRLKQGVILKSKVMQTFQFHKGAIKTLPTGTINKK